MSIEGYAWLVVAACAFMVGLSKTGVPGIGILGVVSLAFVVPARASVGLMLVMLVTGDMVAVAWYRRHAVWSHLARLIPPALAGLWIGFALMGRINDRQLAVALGCIVIALLILNRLRGRIAGEQFRLPTTWWVAWPIGIAAGITTMLSNAAGPIIFLYFLAMRLDKHEFIGTGAWYFFILNSLKIPFLAWLGLITIPSLRIDAMMLPVILAGAATGIVVFKRIPQKAFGLIVEALTLLAAIKLLVPPGAMHGVRALFG